jgi:hypothetical protein
MQSPEPPPQMRRKLLYEYASARFPCSQTHQWESAATGTSAGPGSPPSEPTKRSPKLQAFRYCPEACHLPQGNVTSVGNWVTCVLTVQTSQYRLERSSGEAYVEQSLGMASLRRPSSTSSPTKRTLDGCNLREPKITYSRETGKGRLPRGGAGGPKYANRRGGIYERRNGRNQCNY